MTGLHLVGALVVLGLGGLAGQESTRFIEDRVDIKLAVASIRICGSGFDEILRLRFDATLTYRNFSGASIVLRNPERVQIVTARERATLERGGYDIDETAGFEDFGMTHDRFRTLPANRSVAVRPWIGISLLAGSFDIGTDLLRPGGTYYLQVRRSERQRSNIVRFHVPSKPVIEPNEACGSWGPFQYYDRP